MSARIWGERRRVKRHRAALRTLWLRHASVRRIYPVKSDWLYLATKKGSSDD